ncbi:Cof-type HAD-IIB family hydrolase [Bacteroides sp.]|uniref:Cof-type HAD-IIB family hydrolase n=1 Tax=Bacteroides sp. TaxID=29523 RepID=UPI002FC917E0
MNTYKMLVLDLDGTLTNTQKEITPRTREVLIELQRKGVLLVLASGRPTYGIAPLADELQMDRFGGYILSYNGGEIIDWSNGTKLYENVLPDSVVPQLYAAAAEHQVTILTYDEQYIVTEHPDDPYVGKEAFLNKMEVRPCSNFLQEVRLPLPKCLIVGDADRLISIEAELSLALQGEISVYRSEPYFLELVPMGIDKAQSLAVLLKEKGLSREEMVAVGDGYNDLSMIEFAGMGVAMANAQEPVKKAADYVTLSNEEEGVAAVVERFF